MLTFRAGLAPAEVQRPFRPTTGTTLYLDRLADTETIRGVHLAIEYFRETVRSRPWEAIPHGILHGRGRRNCNLKTLKLVLPCACSGFYCRMERNQYPGGSCTR
jgi:hypothetical protein